MMQAGVQIRRFDFSALADFGAPEEEKLSPHVAEALPEVEETPPPPPPPPSFSEAQLEHARSEAFEAGREAGQHEEAERLNTQDRQREIAIENTCKTIVMQAVQLHESHRAALQAQAPVLTQLVLSCARRVAGDAVATQPEAGITNMISQCLGALYSRPDVRLFVHESLKDILQEKLNTLLERAHADCRITVEASAGLEPGDARLQWEDGQAVRSQEAIWQQIESIIGQQDFTPVINESLQPQEQQHPIQNEGEQA
jgi:flagellar assembly protein FliH